MGGEETVARTEAATEHYSLADSEELPFDAAEDQWWESLENPWETKVTDFGAMDTTLSSISDFPSSDGACEKDSQEADDGLMEIMTELLYVDNIEDLESWRAKWEDATSLCYDDAG